MISCALFPLTPALSLGEREHLRQRARKAGGAGISERRATWLPLPEGEGRGEGEGRLQSKDRLLRASLVAVPLAPKQPSE